MNTCNPKQTSKIIILTITIWHTSLISQDWTCKLNISGISPGDTITQQRTFGGDSSATDFYDNGLDVIAPPPAHGFHTYFDIFLFPNYLDQDIRQYRSFQADSTQWALNIQGYAESQLTSGLIQWDPDSLPPYGLFKIGKLNMRDTNHVVFHSDTILFIKYKPRTITLSLSVFPEGGIISPVLGDTSLFQGDTLFIQAIPDSNFRFINWTGPVNEPDSMATYVVALFDTIITVNFEKIIPPKLIFPFFDSLPTEHGWTFKGNDINMFSIEGGKIVQNSIGHGNVKGHFDIPKGAVIDSISDWSLKIKAKVLEIENLSEPYGFFFAVVKNDYVYYVNMTSSAIYIANRILNNPIIISIDNTKFHEFEIVGNHSNSWSFFIDNYLKAEGAAFHIDELSFPLDYEIAFGDGTDSGVINAHGEWASFEFRQDSLLVADFCATQTKGISPFSVNFTDQSIGEVTSWLWDFGDGDISHIQNPIHTYTEPDTYSVSLIVTGPGGLDTLTLKDLIIVQEIVSIENELRLPTKFSLYPVYPNPFNPSANIKFALPKKENVQIQIYNTRGEIVDQISFGMKIAGYHHWTWDANQFSTGIYFVRIRAGRFHDVRKCIFVQ